MIVSRGHGPGGPAWVLARPPPGGWGSPLSLAPPPPEVAEAAGGPRAGAHARVAEAREPARPGRWTHERPRGVGSARLARGHSRCARQVEDDSASLGSVFTAGRRERPVKFPVTPLTSRAGRGLLQPGSGGRAAEKARGQAGSSERPGLPRLPLVSPVLQRAAGKRRRPKGVGVGVGERVASGPPRNLAFPKSRGSAGQERPGAAVASLPGPDSPAAAAVARTPGCGALERQQLGSPGRAPGASGAAPLRPEPEPSAREPAPPFAPSPVRRRGRGSSRGRPRSSALAGTRGAPSPVPAPAPAPSADFCLSAGPFPPENPLRLAGTRPRRPRLSRPRAHPLLPPPVPPQATPAAGVGAQPGASPRVAPAAADCGVVKNSAAAVAGRGRARSAAAKDTGVCESPPARRLPPSRRGQPDSPGPPRRGRAAAVREARLPPSSPACLPLPSLRSLLLLPALPHPPLLFLLPK